MKIIRYIKEMARIAHWLRGYAQALKEAEENGIWMCPCCHGWMAHPPRDYSICPHCKVEFGYDASESDAGAIILPAGKP
jgi:rubrerythrin